MNIEYKEVDHRIWEEELSWWVPNKIFDAHTHIVRPQDCLLKPDDPDNPRPKYLDEWGVIDVDVTRQWNEALLPGREVHYVLLPGVWRATDWDSCVEFMAQSVASENDPLSGAAMPIHPSMTPEWVDEKLRQYRLAGMKPYRTMTDDPVDCRITDMVPEPLLEVADDWGLIITMHMAKQRALADPENWQDIQRLSAKYPHIRWILAHCARCFAPWAIRDSIEHIADLPNVWIDISAVCASAVFDILLEKFPTERIMYGSDGLAGWDRGKYFWWGYTWDFMPGKEGGTPHASSEPTFVLYEELRSLGHTLRVYDWDQELIQSIFWGNAMRLLHGSSDA